MATQGKGGKTAVVLFNLGGPDSIAAVKPFLFNLFNDPAIIGLPYPWRWFLARLVSARRAPVARKIYAEVGGGSPLLRNTEAQARQLEATLGQDARVFIAMRYWHPMTVEAAERVADWGPDEIVLLPLYPQYSSTTTGSSLGEWKRASRMVGLEVSTRTVCCWPVEPGFVSAMTRLIAPRLAETAKAGRPRLLFSAHGLPKRIVAAGDPYQWQVEQSAAAVAAALDWPELDWNICYQSRVGPLEWIGPATDDEIRRAGAERRPVVLAPIAFVSEHSETLVELDIEYGRLAREEGVPVYRRVPTVGTEQPFIEGLARLVGEARKRDSGDPAPNGDMRICPAEWGQCPCI